MKIIFSAFLFFAFSAFADTGFPLVGRSFMFFEGGSKTSFALLEDVAPKKAIFVQFLSTESANIYWANLEGMYFNNTIDIATEITKQFSSNVIYGARRGSLMNDANVFWNWEENSAINAKWSCKDALQTKVNATGNMYATYNMVGRINGEEKTISGPIGALSAEKATFDDRPDCWLQRVGVSAEERWRALNGGAFSADYFLKSSTCSGGWCSLNGTIPGWDQEIKSLNTEVYDSVGCFRNATSCVSRSMYDNDDAKKITSSSGLYIIHLFPEVLWRPRNILSGGVYAGIAPVNTAAMRIERKASLQSGGDDPVTAGWRSPLVDEKLSTLISLQLRASELMKDGNVLLRDPSSKPKWTHVPLLGIGYGSTDPTQLSAYTVADMLVKAFSYGKPMRYKFLSSVGANCGLDWADVEKRISTTIYGNAPVSESRVNQLVPYCYTSTDDEAKAMTDGREKVRLAKNSRPCVLFSGTPVTNAVKRWKLKIDPLTNKTYDVSNFIWRGCPDGPTRFWIGTVKIHRVWPRSYSEEIINYLNRNQILDELATPFERCNPGVVANACRVYDWVYNYTKLNPSVDWSGQIMNYADKRRKTACPDVKILQNQLANIAKKNPQLLPTTCKADPFRWTVATYPAWTPTYPMANP